MDLPDNSAHAAYAPGRHHDQGSSDRLVPFAAGPIVAHPDRKWQAYYEDEERDNTQQRHHQDGHLMRAPSGEIDGCVSATSLVDQVPTGSEVVATIKLGFVVFRCASANGIAQTAMSKSR
jgi:hypothetical protein